MKKINLYHGDAEPLAIMFFDMLCSYNQSLYKDRKSDWKFVVNSCDDDFDLNIALMNICDKECHTLDAEKFDIVMLCNHSEPLHVFNHDLLPLLDKDNVFLLSNSYLENNHAMEKKVVWFPACIFLCIEYWLRSFYPQVFENHVFWQLERKNKLVAINGQNRAHRHYFFDLLAKSDADVEIISNLGSRYYLFDSAFELQEDLEFRDFVNSRLPPGSLNDDSQKNLYYESSVKVGINEKFGSMVPGYFLMKEYFENTCVIFPESCWQNDQLSATEKIAKCFYSGSVPFPIGGSNINYLYNDLGYQTAWNLLPNELKKFDREKNHALRYQGAIEAIGWLDQNRDIFLSQTCNDIIIQNKRNFFDNSMIISAVKKLHHLIFTFLDQIEIAKH